VLEHPESKYRPFQPIGLTGRSWPDRAITRPPIWLSTDLRDGNQALFEPMRSERKLRLFQLLVKIGLKEIEIAFPAASETEFAFVRELIEGGHVPDDVTIAVLTQAREPLIRRTLESLNGAKRAIVHFYTATAKPFRDMVLKLSQPELTQLAVDSAIQVRDHATAHPETKWILEYSPECFTSTELEFARAICDAVVAAWGATPTNKIILNLPATVEVATPNIYADQIEWMHRKLAKRDCITLSVHPHNDRGCAVAAAELAQMAGAERVEGCLFGNGERTGNVDLVTLALNLYTQGIHPRLEFANINEVARVVADCTSLPIHPRHPYVGDLVFTAFAGSHQDAIKKGMAAQSNKAQWEVPYLPIDPADLGRSYNSIIRVNSQSGKGGVSYLLESAYGLTMPRRLQVEFSTAVQNYADSSGKEVSAQQIWSIFETEYLSTTRPVNYLEHLLYQTRELQGIELTLELDGEPLYLQGEGNGPIDALIHALKLPLIVQAYEEHSLGSGADAKAIAFVELSTRDDTGSYFGVGIDANIVTASIKAIVSGLNRGCREGRLRDLHTVWKDAFGHGAPHSPFAGMPAASRG